MLAAAREAHGQDWKPAGSVFEGDVRQRVHREAGFLNAFTRRWDGTHSPERAYAGLDDYPHRLR